MYNFLREFIYQNCLLCSTFASINLLFPSFGNVHTTQIFFSSLFCFFSLSLSLNEGLQICANAFCCGWNVCVRLFFWSVSQFRSVSVRTHKQQFAKHTRLMVLYFFCSFFYSTRIHFLSAGEKKKFERLFSFCLFTEHNKKKCAWYLDCINVVPV